MNLKRIKHIFNFSARTTDIPPTLDNNIAAERLTDEIYLESCPKFKAIIPKEQIYNLVKTAINNKNGNNVIFADIANLLINAGQAELALDYFDKALKIMHDPITQSLSLQALVLSPEATDERIMRESLKYATQYTTNSCLTPPYQLFSHKSANKKLKVGYACHFFHNSVSQSIILPFISAHDRNRIEVFCYYDWDKSAANAEVRSIADHWRDTKDLNNDAFCQLVKDDDIDILVEMNGHTVINRYHAFTKRIAPIQISFYNFAATCGVPNMDYIIVDNKVLEPSEEIYFTEKVYRLPNAYGIANFSNSFPEVSPLPFKKNGYITFGSFGASHKINELTIKLWCQVLHQTPNAKFFMKAGTLTHDFYKQIFYRYFQQYGIDRNRLILEGWSEHHEMLKRYADVDIALDSFPYNAGTTTLEALWQGIPVISLCGNRLAARTGKSILTNLGHAELIAYSENEFINICTALANKPETLASLRSTLRESFRQSPLYDARKFASDLEDAYYAMWAIWLNERSSRIDASA